MGIENATSQFDMFTGKLVDNRTRAQKKADQERAKPQQMLMFSQRAIAQFGVNAHPLIPLSPHTKLVLVSEDPRTPEERERDLQREAEALTCKLFPEEASPNGSDVTEAGSEDQATSSTIVYDSTLKFPPVIQQVVGLRARIRQSKVRVRRRPVFSPSLTPVTITETELSG